MSQKPPSLHYAGMKSTCIYVHAVHLLHIQNMLIGTFSGLLIFLTRNRDNSLVSTPFPREEHRQGWASTYVYFIVLDANFNDEKMCIFYDSEDL